MIFLLKAFLTLLCTNFSTIHAANTDLELALEAAAQGTSVPSKPLDRVSEAEFLEKIGDTLPADLNSLDNLQSYAAFYAKDRNISMVEEGSRKLGVVVFETISRPCLKAGNYHQAFSESTKTRMQQIYGKALLLKSPSIARFESEWADVYFSLNYLDSSHKEEIKKKYASFLMANNRDLFPDFEEVLNTSFQYIQLIKKDSDKFIAQVRQLSHGQIAKWMNLEKFSEDEKKMLLNKISNINNDIKALYNLLSFMTTNLDSIQILDLLHYAEQNFDLALNIEPHVNKVRENGLFYEDGKVTQVVRTKTHGNFVSYAIKDVSIPPRADIIKFFTYRDFPLRTLGMFALSNAILFKDFANRVRKNAGLSAVSENIFVQSDSLKQTLKINTKLLSLDNMIAQQSRRAEHDAFGSVRSIPVSSLPENPPPKNKKRNKKSASHPQEQILPISLSHENVAEKEPLAPVVEEQAEPLGALIYNLLTANEQQLLTNLFEQDYKHFSLNSIKTMVLSVYRALVDLNEIDIAIKFLKKHSDARLFEKNKENDEFFALLKKRLAVFLMLDIIPPGFDKEKIIESDEDIKIQVLTEKILFDGKKARGVAQLDQLLMSCEAIIKKSKDRKNRRELIINLAYSWHRYARELEQQQSKMAASTIAKADAKIATLLKKAQHLPKKRKGITVLEAYLMSFYLKTHETPQHQTLTDNEFADIQVRAFKALKHQVSLPSFELKTIDQDKNELPPTKVSSSLFHAMTNSEVDDYVMLKFTKPLKDREIPLFITINEKIYRTDVFGGSRLRPDMGNKDYGSLIAVSLRAGEFFRRWFTSEESFWYGQRAFMPRSNSKAPQSFHGNLRILTVPDEDEFVINNKLLVHDGFGYIKESLAKQLGLRPLERGEVNHKRQVAFQSLHSYDTDRKAAQDLFDGVVNRHEALKSLTPSEQANGYSVTIPKITAVGVPVAGSSIMVPHMSQWKKLAEHETMIGRNPYSSMSLRWVPKNKIIVNQKLNSLRVFQYTLTGLYHGDMSTISGSFFKGLLGVISDKDWPAEYQNFDIIVSTKDEKLNQAWLHAGDKANDLSKSRAINMRGVLYVTDDMHKKQLIGLPPKLTDELAGDFDGDEYDALDCNHYPNVVNMVKSQSKSAISNPKIKKSFTTREHEGNYERILALRKPILAKANNIQNRFYQLPPAKRSAFAAAMSDRNLLHAWLEPDVALQFVDCLDIVTAEIQVMIKFGEDIFKTKVHSNQVMQRVRAYERALDAHKSARTISYGRELQQKIAKSNNIADAMKETLEAEESANNVQKATRAVARYLNEDMSYDAYLSDDD